MTDETAKPYFKMTIDDRAYTYSRLTLEDARLLKRDFGVKFEDYDVTDPDYITGMLFLALREEKPDAPVASLMAEAGSIDFLDYLTGLTAEVNAPAEDPTPAAETAAETDPEVPEAEKASPSVTTPPTSGPPVSPETTESAPPAS